MCIVEKNCNIIYKNVSKLKALTFFFRFLVAVTVIAYNIYTDIVYPYTRSNNVTFMQLNYKNNYYINLLQRCYTIQLHYYLVKIFYVDATKVH